MYRWSLKSNEPREDRNHFQIKLKKKSHPEWHNPQVKLGFVDLRNIRWSEGTIQMGYWQWTHEMLICFDWVKQQKNNRGCEGTIQNIWFAGTNRFTYELSTKKSYSLASKYTMRLQKILGVMAQLIKIFHESRVRNRTSLLFSFD